MSGLCSSAPIATTATRACSKPRRACCSRAAAAFAAHPDPCARTTPHSSGMGGRSPRIPAGWFAKDPGEVTTKASGSSREWLPTPSQEARHGQMSYRGSPVLTRHRSHNRTVGGWNLHYAARDVRGCAVDGTSADRGDTHADRDGRPEWPRERDDLRRWQTAALHHRSGSKDVYGNDESRCRSTQRADAEGHGSDAGAARKVAARAARADGGDDERRPTHAHRLRHSRTLDVRQVRPDAGRAEDR